MDLPALNESELKWCKEAALNAERRGRKYKQKISYYTGLAAIENRELSYRAEYSVAKLWGLKPNADDTFNGPDVGHWVKVRLNRRGPDLLVPDTDGHKRTRESYAYVLVLPVQGGFKLGGWLGGVKVFDRLPSVFREGDAATYRVTPDELWTDWNLLRMIATSGPL